MRWRKLGRIFDPHAHNLPMGGAGYAKSPQAVVFDDFVRVYFSTCSRDASGKLVSQVAFADFSQDFGTIRRVANRPVLPLGELGGFDEHGIFPFSPQRRSGQIWAYTTGWSRRVSVSVETAIGLAVSSDGGESFVRHGSGPILAASPREPYLVMDGFVRESGGFFHMWYLFGTGWKRFSPDSPPDRIYKIGHAISTDGIEWQRPHEGTSIIPDRLGPDESQALPSVLEIDGRHHMFFCFRESFDFRTGEGRGYRIGHAWSDDLIHWTRDDEQLTLSGQAGEWDGEMQCYPHAFACKGDIYLLYNGNAFGRDGFGLAVLER